MLARADLVLGMERRHVREAVVLLPEIMPKAFTLKELVRRGEEFGARTRGRSLEDWLVDVAGTARRTSISVRTRTTTSPTLSAGGSTTSIARPTSSRT